MKKISGILVLGLMVLMSCGGDGSQWSQAEKDEFLGACTQNSSTTYCNCALIEVEKLYPNAAESDQITVEQLIAVALKCS